MEGERKRETEEEKDSGRERLMEKQKERGERGSQREGERLRETQREEGVSVGERD